MKKLTMRFCMSVEVTSCREYHDCNRSIQLWCIHLMPIYFMPGERWTVPLTVGRILLRPEDQGHFKMTRLKGLVENITEVEIV